MLGQLAQTSSHLGFGHHIQSGGDTKAYHVHPPTSLSLFHANGQILGVVLTCADTSTTGLDRVPCTIPELTLKDPDELANLNLKLDDCTRCFHNSRKRDCLYGRCSEHQERLEKLAKQNTHGPAWWQNVANMEFSLVARGSLRRAASLNCVRKPWRAWAAWAYASWHRRNAFDISRWYAMCCTSPGQTLIWVSLSMHLQQVAQLAFLGSRCVQTNEHNRAYEKWWKGLKSHEEVLQIKLIKAKNNTSEDSKTTMQICTVYQCTVDTSVYSQYTIECTWICYTQFISTLFNINFIQHNFTIYSRVNSSWWCKPHCVEDLLTQVVEAGTAVRPGLLKISFLGGHDGTIWHACRVEICWNHGNRWK